MTTERNAIIQNEIGLSPKDIIQNELLNNPENFQVEDEWKAELFEFRQGN